MPIIPGRPLLVPEMAIWLTDRITIQAPTGPDWITLATDVPARLLEGLTRTDPVTLQRAQETVLYVPHGTPVDGRYRVQKAGKTRWWAMGGARDYAEAPTVEVPLTVAV